MNEDNSMPGTRILVAEDSAMTRQLLGMVLEGAGYGVDLVDNGASAVEALRQRDYSLVLLDLGMPEMDGYTAIAALRQLPSHTRQIPVVALTARTGAEEINRCRSAGLDGYMTKPFSPLKLIDEVRRWTSNEAMAAPLGPNVPIWDRPIFREVADRLGPAKTEKALDMFEEHLMRSFDALRTSPEDSAIVGRETHALVGIAGLLGFCELAELSRQVMIGQDKAAAEPSVEELLAAGERALACLRHMPHSALV